jgi:hypothetical protein
MSSNDTSYRVYRQRIGDRRGRFVPQADLAIERPKTLFSGSEVRRPNSHSPALECTKHLGRSWRPPCQCPWQLRRRQLRRLCAMQPCLRQTISRSLRCVDIWSAGLHRLLACLRACEGTRFSANPDEHPQENESRRTHHQQDGHQPSQSHWLRRQSIGKSPDLAFVNYPPSLDRKSFMRKIKVPLRAGMRRSERPFPAVVI